MDQITQGAPTPVPPSPSPQPGPQQIPPAVPPPQSVLPLVTSGPGTSGVPSGAPSKLKNPKLWIGVGVLLLVVVVGAAIFLGKPPLFPGKSQLPGAPTLPGGKPAAEEKGAADMCAKLDEAKCAKAAERGICAWADGKCQAARGAVAPVGPEGKAPGGVPGVIGPVVPGADKEPPVEPPPAATDFERMRNASLAQATSLVAQAEGFATEAQTQAETVNTEPAKTRASDFAREAKNAAEAAKAVAQTIKNAQTEEEIQNALANIQVSHGIALTKRDAVTALANAAAAQELRFKEICEKQEKANYDSDARLCTLTDGTKVSNIAELEEAVRRIQEESARRAFQEDCESEKLQWQDKDNQCIFNGTAYNNSQALEAALAAVADEDQKKKDCEDKNKDLKTPEWRWDGKECVGGKVVAIAEVPKCPLEKPVFFGNECHEQNELCSTLGAKLTDELKAKNVVPEDIEHAVIEMNSLSDCGFTAAQFLAPFEEEKAKNECAAKDQDVWEWNAGEKQCKNKQEGRIRELENLVASLQGQLANAQNSNNNAQINALAQQIATLNSQINELRGAADDEPIVITVVAPPAPVPAPAAPPAAPAPAPAAPPSGGGGGGEVVAVAVPEVKKEEKKDSKKKKGAKTGTDATSAETAAASAPAVSDSGAAATAPAKTAAAATGGTGAKAASGAAGAASAAHGAFIQGRTGPGVLIYPLAVISANGVYYFLRRRRKK